MHSSRFWRRLSGYLFVLPYLLLFGVFLILPLFYGFGLSFFRWEMLSPAPPRPVGLGNYAEALGDDFFRKALWATFKFVVMVVPFTIVSALVIATGLSSLSRGRQSCLRAAYFLPTIVTISVAGILWRWFFNGEFGLFNAYLDRWFDVRVPWISDAKWAMPSVVLMTLWWTIGGPVVILMAGILQVPEQYHEAAAIDGAGPVQRWWCITLPIIKPVLFFVTIMSVIGAWQVFGQTYVITSGGPGVSTRVLVQYIYDTAFAHYRMGYGAAMSWLLFAIIAVFSILQYLLMRGRRA